jgi:hypothetical protein
LAERETIVDHQLVEVLNQQFLGFAADRDHKADNECDAN